MDEEFQKTTDALKREEQSRQAEDGAIREKLEAGRGKGVGTVDVTPSACQGARGRLRIPFPTSRGVPTWNQGSSMGITVTPRHGEDLILQPIGHIHPRLLQPFRHRMDDRDQTLLCGHDGQPAQAALEGWKPGQCGPGASPHFPLPDTTQAKTAPGPGRSDGHWECRKNRRIRSPRAGIIGIRGGRSYADSRLDPC